jgi:hypothetical protein
MLRSLVLLLDLLTNYHAVESLARDLLTLGVTNTAIAVLIAGCAMLRRWKPRRPIPAPSRA